MHLRMNTNQMIFATSPAWVLGVVPQRASSACFLRRGRAGLQAGVRPPHICHSERSEESASFQIQIMRGRAPSPVQAEQSSAPRQTRLPQRGSSAVEEPAFRPAPTPSRLSFRAKRGIQLRFAQGCGNARPSGQPLGRNPSPVAES